MKKLFKFALGFMAVLMVMLGVAACTPHEHTYSESWFSDETSHWRQTTCDHEAILIEKAEHEWAVELLNGEKCGTGAVAKFTCKICGKTKEASAENHNYLPTETKAATCTQKGYTIYNCEYCQNTAYADFKNALGHNYGDGEAIKSETCTSDGKYKQICENCKVEATYAVNATGHDYVIVFNTETSTTYECSKCFEQTTVNDGEEVKQVVGKEEVFDVEPTFAFNITTDRDENYIKENLKIVINYFKGTEHENHEEVSQEYTLADNGDGTWTVAPANSYEYDMTYAVMLGKGIEFSDYSGNELVFTTQNDENHENIVNYKKDSVLFLAALENENPGYFPYYIIESDDSQYLYVSVSKADNLSVGQIVCIGSATNMEEIDKSCVLGKIDSIYPLPQGQWMLVLTAPDLREIFEELDIAYSGNIVFNEDDINKEELEAQLVSSLYESEDFVKFLSVVKLSATEYLADRNYDVEAVADTRSFLDKIKFDFDIWIDGLKLVSNVEGTLSIPIKDNNKREIGTFSIRFVVDISTEFDVDVDYELKWGWIIPIGVDYFDVCVTQVNVVGFSFNVSIDVDYSYEKHKYVQNLDPKSQKIHRNGCPHVSNISDNSEWKKLSVVEVEKKLSEKPELACKYCQPLLGLQSEVLVLNTDQKVIHVYGCKTTEQMSEANKQLSEEKATYWILRGYTCCDWCHPDTREEDDYAAYYSSNLYCTDWQQIATDISQVAKDAGVAGFSKKGITLARVDIVLCWPITLTFEVDFVFSLKVEASINYEYRYEQVNTYGMHVQDGQPSSYSSKDQNVLANDLTIMGKVEVRAGFLVDVNINIMGLSRWIRAGVTAEVGFYAELSGVLHVSGVTDEFYAAAYFEAGLYLEVEAYYVLFAWDGDVTIYTTKWPLICLGYEKAYFGYETYVDRLEIDNSYDIAARDLLKVKYFDLKSMETKIDELSLLENEKYKVNISFVDGKYCKIKDGVITYTDDAPCYFTDQMIITVESDTHWTDFKRGSAVFYIKEYVIDLEFTTDNDHDFVLSTAIEPTCLQNGLDTFVCSACQEMKKEVVSKLGHNPEVVKGTAATCTETGLVDGKKCSRCGEILLDQIIIPANGHIEVILEAKAATCTETGLTEGKMCSECKLVIIEQIVIHLAEHIPITVEGKEATCVETGLTEGKKCVNCKNILVAQETIPLKPHSYDNDSDLLCNVCGFERICKHGETEVIKGYEATCSSTGLSDGERCNICGEVLVAQEVVQMKEHTEETIPGKQATCSEAGITDGVKCSVCNTTITAQQPIAIKAHEYVNNSCTMCGRLKSSEGLLFTSNGNGTCTVSGIGTCTDTHVVIPSYSHDNEIVSAIGENAFENCRNVLSIVIPESVTSIGDYAFENCYKLVEVINKSSLNIEKGSSDNGSVASYAMEVHNGASKTTSLDGYIFYTYGGVNYLLGYVGDNAELTLPDSYNGDKYEIYQYAFYDRDSLVSVGFRGATSVGEYAFYNCDSLISVGVLGATNIGDSAFYNCDSLTSVVIFGVTSIGDYAFYDCDSLTSVDGIGSEASVAIIGVTSIGSGAFYSCDSLTSVVIPGSVTSIGSRVFLDCDSLTSATIGNGVTSIGSGAFYSCDLLTSITIPDSVTSIGNEAFFGCYSLTSIAIPKNVTSIGDDAFCQWGGELSIKNVYYTGSIEEWCQIKFGNDYSNPMRWGANLHIDNQLVTEINIPSSITVINDYAFYGCNSLTSVTVHGGVKSIGNNAFAECGSLESIDVSVENANYISLNGNLYTKDGKVLLQYAIGKTEPKFAIPNGVTNIASNAFCGCDSLTDVTIPDSVTSIGDYAFYDCDSLTNITIPDSVTNLGDYAFRHCDSLAIVKVGNGVTSIDYIFYDCHSLVSVEIGRNVTRIGSNEFMFCSKLVEVINKSSLDIKKGSSSNGYIAYYALEVHDGESEIVNVEDYLFYTYGGTNYLLCYVGNDTELTLPESYNGEKYEIYKDAFYDCDLLTSVTITGATSIGSDAFRNCDSLTSVAITGATSIGDYAFYNCYKLVEVINKSSLNIEKGSSSNGYVAYYALEVHNGESKIINVEDYLFYTYDGTNYLVNYVGYDTEQVLPQSYNNEPYVINQYAFSDCDSLTNVVIGNGVTSIGDYAFYGCTGLASITIPDSVTSIGWYAFYGCTGLTSITIPDSVTSIGWYAFYNCEALTNIYYTGTEEEWAAISIGCYNDPLANATIHYNYVPEE